MEQIFFSQKNQLALYDIVRSRIQKLQNYDIAHDPKWANEIVKVMQHVYANQPHFGIDPKMQPMQKSEVLTKKAIQVAAQTIQNELARSRPAVAPRTTFTQQYEQPRVTMPNTFQQTPPSQNYTSPVMNQPQTQYTSMQQPMQQIPQYTSYQMQQSQGHEIGRAHV